MDPMFESLEGSLTRDAALTKLLAPRAPQGADCELLLNARSVDVVDVLAGTATRMRMARHLREHPQGQVTIWPPRRSEVAARFLDLLSPLPDGVSAGQANATAPSTFTLLAASQIRDGEDAMLAGCVTFDACHDARVGRTRAGFAALAAIELSDNALIHAADATDPPVLAAACFGRERIVEVAVTDLGGSISESNRPAELLAALPRHAAAGKPGFLGQILRCGREAGVDIDMNIMAGVGRLRWTRDGHRVYTAPHVQGMTVVARIGA